MKDQAAIDLLSDVELYELAQKLCNCPDDLIQEVAMVLLEMPEEKWQQINEGGYLRFYVVRTMMTMATSPRSSFSKLYDLHNHKKVDHDREDYDWEKEDDISLIETLMEELHWYDREVLKLMSLYVLCCHCAVTLLLLSTSWTNLFRFGCLRFFVFIYPFVRSSKSPIV